MKPAFLTPEYPHPETARSGGIGTSIKNLAGALAGKGYPVTIIVYGQKEDFQVEHNGITVYGIKNVVFKGLSWYLTRKKIERLINKLYSENRIDFVEAPDWTGITSFISPKCPVVIRLNGSDTYFSALDRRKVKWVNRFHERRALKKADFLLSVSQYTADVTNQLFNLNRDFTILPNCTEIQPMTGVDVTDVDTILYFGTLIRKKGLLELPLIFNEVFKRRPSAKLILVGHDSADIQTGKGSTWEIMKTLFDSDAFKNVTYKGAVPHTEITEYIRRATVCVFPSFAEALPVSWIEAMAYKKAIVASDIGWATEVIVDGKEGYLAHPTDHAKFADRILMLLADEEIRRKVGENALQKIYDKFETSRVVSQTVDFYKMVINVDKN